MILYFGILHYYLSRFNLILAIDLYRFVNARQGIC
jgi:hypothetical protein